MTTLSLDQPTFDALRDYVAKETRIALGDDKQYLVETRLRPLLESEACTSWNDLLKKAQTERSHRIRDLIVDAMTTNETLWFRDGRPFDVLREKLLPEYADEIRSGRRQKIRIWSAACSTGQEPYSIMITALEYMRTQRDLQPEHIEILASDISDAALDEAKEGRYNSVAISRGLSSEMRDRYFVLNGRHWEISPDVRSRITFRRFNLQDTFSVLGTFDMIFSRYVAIYFNDEFKRELYRKYNDALVAGGCLFLGSSETLSPDVPDYQMRRLGNAVFYQSSLRSLAGLGADGHRGGSLTSSCEQADCQENTILQDIMSMLDRINARQDG